MRKRPRKAECACGEPDVYDGWAECELHPSDNSAPVAIKVRRQAVRHLRIVPSLPEK